MMDYITEIKAFYGWIKTKTLSDSAINLWNGLMSIAEAAGFPNEMEISPSTIISNTGLSLDKIKRARKELQDMERIKFFPIKGKSNTVYTIVQFAVQNHGQNPLNSARRNEGEAPAVQNHGQNPLNSARRNESDISDLENALDFLDI
jgi:hypothetical protein